MGGVYSVEGGAYNVPFRGSVEVMGPTEGVIFPNLCIRCGEAARATIPVQKQFFRTHTDSPGYYVTHSLDAPVCQSCLDSHRRDLPPIAPGIKNRLLGLWLIKAFPYFFPLGVCLFFVKELAPKAMKAYAKYGLQPEHLIETGVWLAVVFFFGLLAAMFVNMILKEGGWLIYNGNGGTDDRYIQVERGPLGSHFILPVNPPPTLSAINFTDDRSELFDQERHEYTFANPTVAEQFAALNAHREWNPNTPNARRNATFRWFLIAAFILFGLVAMVFDKH